MRILRAVKFKSIDVSHFFYFSPIFSRFLVITQKTQKRIKRIYRIKWLNNFSALRQWRRILGIFLKLTSCFAKKISKPRLTDDFLIVNGCYLSKFIFFDTANCKVSFCGCLRRSTQATFTSINFTNVSPVTLSVTLFLTDMVVV